jgi:hypothetical protein
MLADPLSRGAEEEFQRRHELSGLAARFGRARRIDPPAAFLRRWLARLGKVKRDAAAIAEEMAPRQLALRERRLAAARRSRARRVGRERRLARWTAGGESGR